MQIKELFTCVCAYDCATVPTNLQTIIKAQMPSIAVEGSLSEKNEMINTFLTTYRYCVNRYATDH